MHFAYEASFCKSYSNGIFLIVTNEGCKNIIFTKRDVINENDFVWCWDVSGV